MNAKTLLEDAEALLRDGRFEGALAQVLIAVAGTSKKRYPRPCPDNKAFMDFVRDEWYAIAPCTGMSAVLNGEEVPMEKILYKILRCTVLHEGEMPQELVFEESDNWFIRPETGRLVLSKNWITGLMRSVVLAKENEPLFKDVASQWRAPWWPGGSGMTVTGGLNIRIAEHKKQEDATC